MHGRGRVDRDHNLLDALRRGDPTAPDELVRRYRRRALRLASGITGNHEDAEDVVQDAFWSVVRKINAFRGDSAFGSWLYRIVVNAAYQNRRRRRATGDEASLDDVVPGPVRDWPAAADDPALRAERRCALAAAMDELPAAARGRRSPRGRGAIQCRGRGSARPDRGARKGARASCPAVPPETARMQILTLAPRAQDRAPDGAVVRVRLLPEPCMWIWEICGPRGDVIDSGWASEWAAYDSAEEAYAAGEERVRSGHGAPPTAQQR